MAKWFRISLSMLFPVQLFALQITEIFYKGGPFVRPEERFIEIYNEGTECVNLSNLTIAVPKSDSETLDIGVAPGKFGIRQNDVVTDSTVLPPGKCAVVLTEDYNKFAKLLPIAPGGIVLKPKLKSFSGWSWADRTGLIALKTNGAVIFSCGNYAMPRDKDLYEERSVSLVGGRYAVTELSPGIQNGAAFYPDSRIVRGQASVVMRYSGQDFTNEPLNADVFVNSGFQSAIIMNRIAPGEWEARFFISGYSHGDDIRFLCNGNAALVRYLETRPLSADFRSVLINEIVTDPKTDNSGGGWTGNDGGGKIDETDEWMELVNASDRTISLSNYFVLYKSKTSESIKGLSFRTNAGFGSRTNVISNFSYLAVSPEGGMADNAYIGLYDGYPFLDGRLVDEVEYGDEALNSPDAWNNAPGGKSSGKDDEAIVRVPNAVADGSFRAVFRKLPASFARMNVFTPAFLWVKDVTGLLTNGIWLIDPDNANGAQDVTVFNGMDRVSVLLTNYGIYFFGILNMRNGDGPVIDGILDVKNGIRNTVRFDHGPGGVVCREFNWASEGWSLPKVAPDTDHAIVYPNPAPAGKKNTLVFANLPDGAVITVIDPRGNIVKQLINNGNGFATWETELKKGIYVAVIRAGDSSSSRKLLVR